MCQPPEARQRRRRALSSSEIRGEKSARTKAFTFGLSLYMLSQHGYGGGVVWGVVVVVVVVVVVMVVVVIVVVRGGW